MSIKTTVITGATSGIGKETAIALAEKDHALYLLVRNIEKGNQLKEEIIKLTANQDIFVIACDLSDLRSVQQAANELKSKLFNINVLINNAGGIFATKEVSKNGFVMTFAVNHLAHFLLTDLLMPLLQKGHARIINVSSEAHKFGQTNFDNMQFERDYSSFKAYGNAKLYNILFTKSLAERYGEKGVTAYALHPGFVKTNFGTELHGIGRVIMWLSQPIMVSPKKGTETSIYLATEPKMEPKSGCYFIKKKPAKTSHEAQDEDARNRLWELSEDLINGVLG